jgi:hypothetical protein
MADEITLQVFAKNIADSSKEVRLALAQQLKNAGFWTGKINSDFNMDYYKSLVKLEEAYSKQATLNKIVGTTPPKRLDVLRDTIVSVASGGGGAGGGGGPTTTRQTYVTSQTQTAKILETVAKDLLGRSLTKAEKAKYQKLINAEQKRQPAVNVSGKGFSRTTGGVDEEQFITEKIAGTAEAKTNQASDAYTILMQELGGLR